MTDITLLRLEKEELEDRVRRLEGEITDLEARPPFYDLSTVKEHLENIVKQLLFISQRPSI